MLILVFATASILTCHAVPQFDLTEEHWVDFKVKFNKSYPSAREEQYRKAAFFENLYSIGSHNVLFLNGLVSYERGINHHSDLDVDEAIRLLNGFTRTKTEYLESLPQFSPPAALEIPDAIDWREEGAVTPIKDQRHCGSCYAFSSTGSLEGQYFLKTGILASLSEQNLIDCSENNGCENGTIVNCFQYISQHGIDSEESYPYEGAEEQCRWNPYYIATTVKGFGAVEVNSEEALKAAVASIGPISVAIDAAHASFIHYSGGIYYDENCNSEHLTHAVLVVGYGTTEDGADYWVIKNSWGKTWGLEGYMLMARNRNNFCGIATEAVFPIV